MRLVRSYGLRQEFITPHCPQQNGMIERVIGGWIRFYNTRRPHQALGMKTPAMADALAA
jgi:putative transposase